MPPRARRRQRNEKCPDPAERWSGSGNREYLVVKIPGGEFQGLHDVLIFKLRIFSLEFRSIRKAPACSGSFWCA
jgi:hypothetical protein